MIWFGLCLDEMTVVEIEVLFLLFSSYFYQVSLFGETQIDIH